VYVSEILPPSVCCVTFHTRTKAKICFDFKGYSHATANPIPPTCLIMGSLMYLEVVSSIEYREASVYMVGV
jgi:hypothetical protein